MRTIIIHLAILFTSTCFCYSQNSPEEYIDSFFKYIAQERYEDAMYVLPANQRLDNDTSYLSQTISRLENFRDAYGRYCGYELIEKKEVSPSYIVFSYFIKYSSAPQRIQFVFYKPEDAWQLNQVTINSRNNQGPGNRRKGNFPLKDSN
jgi:hypothetical protein